MAALAEIAIIVIQAPIFILYPQPTTVMSHFTQPLREYGRLLRPGGLLHRIDVEIGVSNAPAHEDFWSLFLQAMRRTDRSFSPNDRHLGIRRELEPLVSQAGFYMMNYSCD
ncbi:MAG TPA: hypothetical protein VFV38_16750 [Ktedonobacteraceae bacterium]|nr:hypothetical protein [Ktedonobacteraceae bacterium]